MDIAGSAASGLLGHCRLLPSCVAQAATMKDCRGRGHLPQEVEKIWDVAMLFHYLQVAGLAPKSPKVLIYIASSMETNENQIPVGTDQSRVFRSGHGDYCDFELGWRDSLFVFAAWHAQLRACCAATMPLDARRAPLRAQASPDGLFLHPRTTWRQALRFTTVSDSRTNCVETDSC